MLRTNTHTHTHTHTLLTLPYSLSQRFCSYFARRRVQSDVLFLESPPRNKIYERRPPLTRTDNATSTRLTNRVDEFFVNFWRLRKFFFTWAREKKSTSIRDRTLKLDAMSFHHLSPRPKYPSSTPTRLPLTPSPPLPLVFSDDILRELDPKSGTGRGRIARHQKHTTRDVRRKYPVKWWYENKKF